MRAIIHSIHSQVPETIATLDRAPSLMVSVDSHLDVSLGGDYDVYPESLRLIAKRTSVHSEMRRVHGGVPALRGSAPVHGRGPEADLIVAIPERMLSRHASDIESRLPPPFRTAGLKESVRSVIRFLRTEIGIEVYASPPKELLGLVPRTRGSSWLLDVDVDCMREMQRECYTQIRNTAPGVLQSMSDVIHFIEASRPETVTISEARVSAIRDRGSRFSVFVSALRETGYGIEEAGVFGGDREVVRGISVCREFYTQVTQRLVTEHMGEMMAGDFDGFRKEEKRAARKFFAEKGYPP